jgi:hypothetical protein
MPGGPAAIGFVYFAAAKLVGYTAFCRWAIQPQAEFALNLQASGMTASTPLTSSEDYARRVPAAWKAGAVRTLIGVAIGAAVGLGFWKIPYFAEHDFIDQFWFFALLVPVRIGEWWLLLKWIYRESRFSERQKIALIATGIVASFVLDALGVVTAMILPGGFWVC